ncbi:MAG: hypothetical protein U0929_04195 [Planctomycetaceae bacterium]
MWPQRFLSVPEGLRRVAVALSISLFVLGMMAGPVMAQRRNLSSIRRMNEQLRQQEILQLQAQLDEAKKVLDSVASQGTMTEAQLDAARQSALAARQSLNEAAKDRRAASSKIRKIEESLLESQPADSEYGKALDGVDAARRALDAEMHQILGRPAPAPDEGEVTRLAELARLTPEQRAHLNKTPSYTEKKTALNDAMKELTRVKSNLFQDSEEWRKAHEERRKVEQEVAKSSKANRGAAQDSSDAREDLRSATQIAASAKATIAQIEARLHALGAKEKPASDKKPATDKRNP